MGVKINFRIITKNRAADPEIGFLAESILKPYGRAAAIPTAWKLIASNQIPNKFFIKYITDILFEFRFK